MPAKNKKQAKQTEPTAPQPWFSLITYSLTGTRARTLRVTPRKHPHLWRLLWALLDYANAASITIRRQDLQRSSSGSPD